VIRTSIETRRYLARLDTKALGHLYTDTLIIGAGVAGMRAGIAAAQGGQVIILVKDELTESNTYHAQGGIAAVLRNDDSIESHINDTLKTGCGLCDPRIVELVVTRAPAQIEQLQQWSMPFDKENEQLALGREGGHSHSRIVHALGDATGKAVAETLLEQIRESNNIKVFPQCYAIDLLTENGVCCGVFCYSPKYGYQCIWARRTILASGGAGQLYRETSNPTGATADGLAMAYRAGAVLTDLEFMQFHPTTLYIAGAARTLITEALRGEGGFLVDRHGQRFMSEYHEMEELAPRDVVSRAIYKQWAKTDATNVFLDLRHLGSKWLAERFPTINGLCKSFDIDVDSDLIPVRPSAHYMIGGVKADIDGRTNIKNLLCCGEASATGLHGGNRLASNSLLEGLVFGQICGELAAREVLAQQGEVERHSIAYDITPSQRTFLDVPDVTNSLRALMWRNVGLERRGDRLDETVEIIDFWHRYVMDKVFDESLGWQCQNMLTVCRLMADSARRRQESRGVHFRIDYPRRDDENFQHHIEICAAP
jgi:L-aspartate oxidase